MSLRERILNYPDTILRRAMADCCDALKLLANATKWEADNHSWATIRGVFNPFSDAKEELPSVW
jgi:hypothetical protein